MRVLVAEDNKNVRQMIGDVLANVGHIPVLAVNGREAWKLLNEGEHFDHILSDKDMPEMGGVELLQLVRGDDRTANIPFILMSGNVVVSDDDNIPLDMFCTGFSATFLPKPFRIEGLLALLDKEGVAGSP